MAFSVKSLGLRPYPRMQTISAECHGGLHRPHWQRHCEESKVNARASTVVVVQLMARFGAGAKQAAAVMLPRAEGLSEEKCGGLRVAGV